MDLKTLVISGMERIPGEREGELATKIDKYLKELLRWQKNVNLTGFREPEAVVKKLIHEAFFFIKYLQGRNRIVDMGSGSGAISFIFSLLLESDIFSVEKNVKKVSFQKHIKRMLNLPNFHVIHGRIEEIEPLNADAVFAKAFGGIKEIVEKADPHLLSSGILLIPKSPKEKPIQIPNYSLIILEKYKLPMDERENLLFIYEKN